MNTHKRRRAGFVVAASWMWMAATAPAADLVITSFTGNGTVQWSYWTAGLGEYRIEWAANLATAKWTDLETGLRGIAPTNANMSVEVPMFYRIRAMDAPPPNMVYIPPGSFRMGDSFGEGESDELPVHEVYVSGFYLDRCEVTKALWDSVAKWAVTNGYDIMTNSVAGKATNHPANTVTWYEAVKWCNARSAREGLEPCYLYTDPLHFPPVVVYQEGQRDDVFVSPNNGYRLPTEAEWEKAARGGSSGYRFPWADNTISHGMANYAAESALSYDLSSGAGYHPAYTNGGQPYTSMGGFSFGAYGYGLYDLAGNVQEWCWDWYSNGYYNISAAMDPHGPASGTFRVQRGGSWTHTAADLRCAGRHGTFPGNEFDYIGFRCARWP